MSSGKAHRVRGACAEPPMGFINQTYFCVRLVTNLITVLFFLSRTILMCEKALGIHCTFIHVTGSTSFISSGKKLA